MTVQTRMENVAREEGYEAGYDDGCEENKNKNTYVSLSEADKLIGDYGLAVNSMSAEGMRITCSALFDALTGRNK